MQGFRISKSNTGRRRRTGIAPRNGPSIYCRLLRKINAFQIGEKMRFGSRRTMLSVAAGAGVCLLGIGLAGGQTVSEQKPLMAEEAFKNVQVLRGTPVNEFMTTMGFFSASLGQSC